MLGEEAIDLEELARRKRAALGGQLTPMGLADLFFDPDDPLHPDAEDEDWTRKRRTIDSAVAAGLQPAAHGRKLFLFHGGGFVVVLVGQRTAMARPS